MVRNVISHCIPSKFMLYSPLPCILLCGIL